MFLSPNNIIAACIKAAPDNPARDGVILYLLMAYGYNLWAAGSSLKYDGTSHDALGADF